MYKIKLNGHEITYESIKKNNHFKKLNSNESSVIAFLQNWINGEEYFEVKTSGSTGKPKIIKVSRDQMIRSAQATLDALNLQPNDSALLCLSANTIAGKMMIVRSLIGKLNLSIIDPTSNPFQNINTGFTFTALVPLQVLNSTENIFFKNTKNIIIGGAPLEENLRKKLVKLPNTIYQSYGMTETVSHIALKLVDETCYTTLKDVNISSDNRNCLIIDAPMSTSSPLQTNDVVEIINSKQFIWKGRLDFVINSGGIKIHPELLEKELCDLLPHLNELIVFGQADKTFGTIVSLLIKGNPLTSDDLNLLKNNLPKHTFPKEIYYVDNFLYKESGKLDRAETLALLK